MNPQVEAALIAGVVSLVSLGGTVVVAVIGFRTTRKVTGSTLAEQRIRTLNERFTAAAEQLGSDKPPAVRLAGVYAMVGLADDWEENRQTCVDVLCAYLRLPCEPNPGPDAPAPQRLAYQGSREVRRTLILAITSHLRDTAVVSWRGLNFDFSGATFDTGTFHNAKFSSGTVYFSKVEFSSGTVFFGGAEFSGGRIDFDDTKFSGGEIYFNTAKFSGGKISFNNAKFSGGEVHFKGAEFLDGTLLFGGAEFFGGRIIFDGAKFSGSRVYFNMAKFSGATVDFTTAENWSRPPKFGWDGIPPAGVKLPADAAQPSP